MEIQLIQNQISGIDLYHLTFHVPSELSQQFQTAGQYVVLQDGDQKGFFALASKPQGDQFEFLIKKGEGFSGEIIQYQEGKTIECSPVQGNGFQFKDSEQLDLHLFSMGSGIAPFRALILQYLQDEIKAKSITLWQASFTDKHLPFSGEFADWKKGGVTIHECLDQHEESKTICDHLRSVQLNLANSQCFWIGSKNFGEKLKGTLLELGLDENQLSSNF
ncbi:MAG: ferredoxin-NADP reductase [bacterium]|jgi:ferredoxin-NADP reductase